MGAATSISPLLPELGELPASLRRSARRAEVKEHAVEVDDGSMPLQHIGAEHAEPAGTHFLVEHGMGTGPDHHVDRDACHGELMVLWMDAADAGALAEDDAVTHTGFPGGDAEAREFFSLEESDESASVDEQGEVLTLQAARDEEVSAAICELHTAVAGGAEFGWQARSAVDAGFEGELRAATVQNGFVTAQEVGPEETVAVAEQTRRKYTHRRGAEVHGSRSQAGDHRHSDFSAIHHHMGRHTRSGRRGWKIQASREALIDTADPSAGVDDKFHPSAFNLGGHQVAVGVGEPELNHRASTRLGRSRRERNEGRCADVGNSESADNSEADHYVQYRVCAVPRL